MDSDEVVRVLEHIGVEKVRVYSKNVQCSCFLAEYRDGHSSDSDHADSMGISISPGTTSLVHCFACKFKGTLSTAIAELGKHSGEDYDPVIELARALDAEDLEALADSIPDYDHVKVSDDEGDDLLPEDLLEVHTKCGSKYLLNRGISVDTMREWEVHIDEEHKRVMFPIRRFDGRLVGAVGRTLVGHKLRYWNYWDVIKTRFLFGENKILEGTTAVVVEGLLDTVGVWQALRDSGMLDQYSVVGLLGSEVSDIQIRKIGRWFDDVVLFFDRDKAGFNCSRMFRKQLGGACMVREVQYPDGYFDADPMKLLKEGVDIAKLVDDAAFF